MQPKPAILIIWDGGYHCQVHKVDAVAMVQTPYHKAGLITDGKVIGLRAW
ncbi:MAG: hypothetical protein ACRDE2_16960 [Chitinophagaceae bacterium]